MIDDPLERKVVFKLKPKDYRGFCGHSNKNNNDWIRCVHNYQKLDAIYKSSDTFCLRGNTKGNAKTFIGLQETDGENKDRMKFQASMTIENCQKFKFDNYTDTGILLAVNDEGDDKVCRISSTDFTLTCTTGNSRENSKGALNEMEADHSWQSETVQTITTAFKDETDRSYFTSAFNKFTEDIEAEERTTELQETTESLRAKLQEINNSMPNRFKIQDNDEHNCLYNVETNEMDCDAEKKPVYMLPDDDSGERWKMCTEMNNCLKSGGESVIFNFEQSGNDRYKIFKINDNSTNEELADTYSIKQDCSGN